MNSSLPLPRTTPPEVQSRRLRSLMLTVAASASLVACGGGGGSDSGATPPPSSGLAPSSSLAQQCSPNNPYRADASAPTSSASLTVEKQWVRSYVDEKYLWYSQVPVVDATASAYSNDANVYGSIDAYFNAITTVTNDRFSFTYPTRAWQQLSQSGVSLGYGMEFVRASATPPRNYRIAMVEAGTAAANAGLRRGDTIVSLDGVNIDDSSQAGVNTLNAALNPSVAGNHTFVVSRNGVQQPAVVLAAGNVATTPVPVTRIHTVGAQRVGYMLFNDHVLPAEGQLINAINSMAGVTDLVVDLRYNGGGYIFLASQLAYMIAGATRTNGQVFERFVFNDKRSSETNASSSQTPFFNVSCYFDSNFNCTQSNPLPALNLSRVWVLTRSGTCSASEALINGLRGIDVEVRTVGSTTCGKPYGFTAKDNCGVSYFPIEFQGVNAKGFGDYASGMAATCPASDDLSHELGDINEGMLAAALFNRTNGSCSSAFGPAKGQAPDMQSVRGPERSNRIALPAGAALR